MAQSETLCQVQSLDHLVLTVSNIPASIAFYRDVLGMQPMSFAVADGSTRWALKFGASKINLHQSGAEFRPHALNPTVGSADLCFITDMPLDNWITHLTTTNTKIEEGPVARSGATGPLMSLYLNDPDGNLIEISNRV